MLNSIEGLLFCYLLLCHTRQSEDPLRAVIPATALGYRFSLQRQAQFDQWIGSLSGQSAARVDRLAAVSVSRQRPFGLQNHLRLSAH